MSEAKNIMEDESTNQLINQNTNQPTTNYHIPVLLKEAIEGLNIKEDGVYVDCTFGGGGHSKEILKLLGKTGKLIEIGRAHV